MSDSPFVLSIEPEDGKSYMYGFHLGTIEKIARQIAVEKFQSRNSDGRSTRTVALIRDGKIIDVYDGTWQSDDYIVRHSDALRAARDYAKKQ